MLQLITSRANSTTDMSETSESHTPSMNSGCQRAISDETHEFDICFECQGLLKVDMLTGIKKPQINTNWRLKLACGKI